MEKNYLKRVLENEERVNKLVEVLAISPTSHYQVEYGRFEISLSAFANTKDDAQQIENLMRIFASSTDKMEMQALDSERGKFWIIGLAIPLDED